ncbi:hypothetical protein LTR49_025845, partial [Elasticomyces elasticus]
SSGNIEQGRYCRSHINYATYGQDITFPAWLTFLITIVTMVCLFVEAARIFRLLGAARNLQADQSMTLIMLFEG